VTSSNIKILSGPAAALFVVVMAQLTGMEYLPKVTLAITACAILWWITEALPIAVPALLPLALFPVFGILDKTQVSQAYGSHLVLLMLGGFALSKAMERSNTHRHLALMALHAVGGGTERRLVMGFMLAAAMISMWISNTATTLMLLPIAAAVLATLPNNRLAAPLMLGIAYAANIGGMGTPVGTPPNLVFMQVYEDSFGKNISFLQWMSWAMPIVVVLLPLTMFWLTRSLNAPLQSILPPKEPWDIAQKRVMLVFGLTVLLWVTRREPFGGWSHWVDAPGATDASVALLAMVLLFVLPDGKQGRLMDWDTVTKIPWDILILFGGGLCIAKGFAASGLSESIAGQMQQFSHLPVILLMFLLCLVVTLLTETTSNMASATLLMPVLVAASAGMGLAPEMLMVPAVISTSCAFMLPIATAPNAIVYSTRHVTVQRMVKEGSVLSIGGALIISVMSYFLLSA
jgi:sodium-dependent dicarboxylate transporter 2/3/5